MNLQNAKTEIVEHFENYGVDTSRFNVEEFYNHCKEYFDKLAESFVTLSCNLEDVDTMNEIAHGNYESFDPWDESQFNDSYWDMSEELGMHGEDDWENDDNDYTDLDDENNF